MGRRQPVSVESGGGTGEKVWANGVGQLTEDKLRRGCRLLIRSSTDAVHRPRQAKDSHHSLPTPLRVHYRISAE